MVNMEITENHNIVHQKNIYHQINHKTEVYFNKLVTLSPNFVLLGQAPFIRSTILKQTRFKKENIIHRQIKYQQERGKKCKHARNCQLNLVAHIP